MTRSEIEAMPADVLTALLAENVMDWKRCTNPSCGGCDAKILQPHGESIWIVFHPESMEYWNPTTDANDMRELLRAVPADKWPHVDELLDEQYDGVIPFVSFFKWLLTCDPLIICRAVAIACCGGDA